MGLMWAIGAGLCCLALGINSGVAARSRLQRLEEGVEVIQRMRLALEERQPLCRVLQSAGEGEIGCRLYAAGERLAKTPLMTAAQAWEMGEQLPAEDQEWWLKLLKRLGTGTLENRIQALDQGEKQLVLTLERAREKEERNRPLRRSLGGLGAAAVTLLLW